MFKERARKILDSIFDSGFNALMVFKPENIFYLTGFWGECIAMCEQDEIKLIVPYLSKSRFYSDCSDYETIRSILPYTDTSKFVLDAEPFYNSRSIKDELEIEN